MAEDTLTSITETQLEQEVLPADGISMVYFWAPWCANCHLLTPKVENFAQTNVGKLRAFKINADENPEAGKKYSIRSVPTFIFFKGGASVRTSFGPTTESTLQKMLEEVSGG